MRRPPPGCSLLGWGKFGSDGSVVDRPRRNHAFSRFSFCAQFHGRIGSSASPVGYFMVMKHHSVDVSLPKTSWPGRVLQRLMDVFFPATLQRRPHPGHRRG